MDRSRLIVALALGVTLIAIIVGIFNIASASRASNYASAADDFISSSRAGVALINIRGAIADEPRASVSADRVVALLKEARNDASVRAVILAVNSPGGTVGGTKKIYDEVMRLRDVKPVVAIISDIAASGGYYIASAANHVLAYPGSIVGSIGVISFHINVASLLERYGISVTPIKSGRYKDSSYPFRAMTQEELDIRRKMQKAAYQQFIRDVANGREQSFNDVRQKWAGGRIFSGEEAQSLKMIDGFGGREEAIIYLKRTLKTEAKLPILEPRRDFMEELLGSLPFSRESNQTMSLGFLNAPALYFYPSGPGMVLDFLKGMKPVLLKD